MSRAKARNSETRDTQSRVAQARKVPQATHQSKFYIPAHVIPKGMTYAWVAVAYDNAGTQNAENWRAKYRAGWRPVPRTRHPDLFPPVPDVGFGADNDDLIKEGGQILCEKPTADVLAAKEANAAAAKAQMDGVSWMMAAGQNPFMQRFDQSNTTFGHAAEFKE